MKTIGVIIYKKRLNLDMSLYTFLQILSVTEFEKVSIYQLLTEFSYTTQEDLCSKQLKLIEL
jgi:hypothetical protein